MRIALDARDLNRPYLRGQGKYVTELVSRIAKRDGIAWELISDRPDLAFHCPPCDRRGFTYSNSAAIDITFGSKWRFHVGQSSYTPTCCIVRECVCRGGSRFPQW